MNLVRLVTILSALSALSLVGAAWAQGPAPTPKCPVSITDPAGDNNELTGDSDSEDVNLDITKVWFDYDPGAGEKALTANIGISDLSERVPSGSTGVVWNVAFEVGGARRFVRVLIDFSGGPYYEYGTYIPVSDTNPLARYQYEGATEGQFFEGKDGVIQIVVPKAVADSGAVLKGPFASAASSRQAVPGSIGTPTRGLSSPVDQAPDGSPDDAVGKDFTVAPCAAGASPEPTPSPSGGQPQPQPGPAPSSEDSGKQPLPLTVVTKKASRLKRGKSLAIKVRSSEALSSVAAQLRKARSVYGASKPRSVNGAATLRLKLKKSLKKGSYVLDVAGTDSAGARRFTAVKLKVR